MGAVIEGDEARIIARPAGHAAQGLGVDHGASSAGGRPMTDLPRRSTVGAAKQPPEREMADNVSTQIAELRAETSALSCILNALIEAHEKNGTLGREWIEAIEDRAVVIASLAQLSPRSEDQVLSERAGEAIKRIMRPLYR